MVRITKQSLINQAANRLQFLITTEKKIVLVGVKVQLPQLYFCQGSYKSFQDANKWVQ